MKKYLGVISFALIILVIFFLAANITQVIEPGVTTFNFSCINDMWNHCFFLFLFSQ
ncbi:hypothetical protein [Peribacillus butanolivorans]|uniref:hypothetical protein n=1 Tax=Peribacillus butanolivorans TaxID=421767 RepID=UPI0038206E94